MGRPWPHDQQDDECDEHDGAQEDGGNGHGQSCPGEAGLVEKLLFERGGRGERAEFPVAVGRGIVVIRRRFFIIVVCQRGGHGSVVHVDGRGR